MAASTKTKELREFLQTIVDGKNKYRLGDPWKYSEEALAVVVPITRKGAPERGYTTMYEVLKEFGMQDSGSIDVVKIQNKTGKAVFVRAGTIFEGKTQNRAAQNSGVYQPGSQDVKVRCVQQTHGISGGSEMKYGDIAPNSITVNLIMGDQSAVWESVRRYTGGDRTVRPAGSYNAHTFYGSSGFRGQRSLRSSFSGFVSSFDHDMTDASQYGSLNDAIGSGNGIRGTGSDDLLGHIKKKGAGQAMLDDMMQKVPLFEFQCGAIIFDPLGVVAVETFDHPMSWEAIKKEVIEKHGDKIKEEQANHLFELKKDRIKPALQRFIDGLEKFDEHTVRQDPFSETRVVVGDKIVGEYTLVKGKVIHTLMVNEA